MKSYYSVRESWDKRLIKNHVHPQWVHILNKEYCDLMMEQNRIFSVESAKALSSIQKDLFSHFDFDFKGKMDYKEAQDYMDVWPKFRGCFGVINEKIKTIFEDLNISKGEYILHPIDIEGVEDNYYLMFIFQVPISNIILSSSVYCCKPQPEIEYILKTHDQFYDGGLECICPKLIALDKDYSNFDILRIESCWYTYFSERLVNKLKQNKIVGLEYTAPGVYERDVIATLSFE